MAEDYGLGKVTGEAVDLSDDNVNALADAIDSEMGLPLGAQAVALRRHLRQRRRFSRATLVSPRTRSLTNAGGCVQIRGGDGAQGVERRRRERRGARWFGDRDERQPQRAP